MPWLAPTLDGSSLWAPPGGALDRMLRAQDWVEVAGPQGPANPPPDPGPVALVRTINGKTANSSGAVVLAADDLGALDQADLDALTTGAGRLSDVSLSASYVAAKRVPFYGEQFKNLTVLMYHVTPTRTAFAADLDSYLRWNYVTVDPDQVAAWYAGTGTLPDKPLLITFDDGYARQYSEYYPELLARGMKGTIYTTSGFIDGTTTGESFGATDVAFTWAQAKEMYDSGLIRIQAHGVAHTRYGQMTAAEAAADFAATKARIEQMVAGETVRHMAYPHGNTSLVAMGALRGAGCLTARYTRLSRNGVTDGAGPFGFATVYDDPLIMPATGTGAADITQANFYRSVGRDEEMVPDYGFEAGGQGWTLPTGSSIDTTTFYEGTRSLKIVQEATGGSTVSPATSEVIPVGPHGAVEIRMRVKTSGLTSGSARAQIQAYRADGVTVEGSSVDLGFGAAATQDWTEYVYTWRGNPRTSFVVLAPKVLAGGTGGGAAWFDTVSMKRLLALGTFPGAR